MDRPTISRLLSLFFCPTSELYGSSAFGGLKKKAQTSLEQVLEFSTLL